MSYESLSVRRVLGPALLLGAVAAQADEGGVPFWFSYQSHRHDQWLHRPVSGGEHCLDTGVHNWMSYVTGDIPVGAYDSRRLANIGIGHAAIDAGGAYTYFNQQDGREFSVVGGLTYNWENNDTKYKNGIDSHVDWAVSHLCFCWGCLFTIVRSG